MSQSGTIRIWQAIQFEFKLIITDNDNASVRLMIMPVKRILFEVRLFFRLRCLLVLSSTDVSGLPENVAVTCDIALCMPAPYIAKQLNSDGEIYEDKYGLTTSQRLYGTVTENKEGRGPCYLKTDEISDEQQSDLYKAYLNMAPSQTLKWIESGRGPKNENVEIEGTEPYIVGGHTASGYWIDNDRKTTITGLYAAGDVAGGCPQKYVTGALVEGEIAAQSAVEYIRVIKDSENKKADYGNVSKNSDNAVNGLSSADKKAEYESYFSNPKGFIDTEQLEETMQKIMDQYAGGISTNYEYNESRLEIAKRKIDDIEKLSVNLHADDMDDLLRIYELKERLVVCKVLIEHLKARKETRWHSFAENLDYPNKSDDYLKYVNSRYEDGKIKIIYRDLVTGGKVYEHSDK